VIAKRKLLGLEEFLDHRPETHLQRLARLLQERARGQARLMVALGALERSRP
jgi:hypothetical protein